MDIGRLQSEAVILDGLLAAHAGESEAVDALRLSLRPLLDAVKAGQVTSPLPSNSVPGSRPFAEGDLAEVPEVEDAYGRFMLLVSGMEDVLDETP